MRSPWDRNFENDELKSHADFEPKGNWVFWGNLCGFFRAVVTGIAFLALPGTPWSQASGLTCCSHLTWRDFLISSLVKRAPKVF